MDIPKFVYPFIFEGHLLFPFFGYYKEMYSKHMHTFVIYKESLCGIMFSFLWSKQPGVECLEK